MQDFFPFIGERLFELLSGAQSLRIEEQRGVHISPGELPSFLCEDRNKKLEQSQHSEFETLAAQQQLFDDVSEISRAGILEKKARRKMDNSLQDNFPPTPRLSASTPRGTKYGSKTMAVTPLLAHSDQSFSRDGVIPSPGEAEAFFRMSPMIVDSRLTAMGMSLDGALELRNGDKYPEHEMGRTGKSNSSRFSGLHAFQPLHSPPVHRAMAPVASPEKFSPQKKKQRNSPENVLEGSEENFNFMPKRTNLSTFTSPSLHSGPGNLSTPRQNISHLDRSLDVSAYHIRSSTTTSSSSIHTPSQIKSPSPHTITPEASPPHPTNAEGFPQTHSRASAPALNKNRLSDGMLIHKLQQAQSQRESVNPDLNKTLDRNERAALSTRSNVPSPMAHREHSGSSSLSHRKSPDLTTNLAQRALLSPRFDNTTVDRTRPSLQQSSPSQRALLSPRFDHSKNSGRENREPPIYQKQVGAFLTPKTSHQIVGAVLSPRYSSFKDGNSSGPTPTKYQAPGTLPPSNLPVTYLASQSNVFQAFSSQHFSSSMPPPTSQLHTEETVTFV